MHGQVVRAERGQRALYRPIASRLCDGAEPAMVARALVAHCAAQQLYVADLDALQGGAAQIGALRAVLQALPQVEVWLDAGFADRGGLGSAATTTRRRTRRAWSASSAASRCARARPSRVRHVIAQAVLSLDRRDGRRLDAAGCWDLPALWPRRVIVMTLEQVGADAGPDWPRCAACRRARPARR